MVGLEEFKKALGDKAKHLSEPEILKIRELQDKLADSYFDMWLKKRNNISNDNICQVKDTQPTA